MQMRRASSSILLLSLLAFFAFGASAADYFVSPDGNDAAAGTSASAAWRTIAKANAAARPGDTVSLGGGNYVDDPIRPAQSGTDAAPIRYLGSPTSPPRLTSNKVQGLEVAIDLSNRSYITVEGIEVDGVEPSPKARVKHFVNIVNGSYNTIADCTFRYAHGWHGITLKDGAHHNRILDSTVDVVGIYDDGNGQDSGDGIQIDDADYNLIQGNVFTRGAHNLMQVKGQYNVIRGNTFDNDWSEILGDAKGGRNLSLMGQYNVFERNIVRNAAQSTDKPANAGKKAEGEGNIVRRNFIYGNSNEGIISQSRGGSKVARSNHIFHNTIYSNGGPAWGLVFYDGGDGVTKNVFKNNIVFANRKDSNNGDADFLFDLGSNPSGVVGDSLIEGNLVAKQSSGDAMVDIQSGGDLMRLGQAEKQYAQNFKNNIEASPTFASADPKEPNDFALSPGSRGIDEATPLTFTQSAGSGKVIAVTDAGYFFDGFSLVFGDRIQIGAAPPVKIVKVDYAANTLTVESDIEWGANSPVALEYQGSGADIGALEAGLGTRRPGPPAGLSMSKH